MADKIWLGNVGTAGDLNVAANWEPSGVPASGDDVYFRDSAVNVTASLATLTVGTAGLLSLNVEKSFTGTIGLDAAQVQTYMTTDAATINIGKHDGPGNPVGSSMLLIDADDAAVQTINIDATGNSSNTNKPACRIITSANANILNIRGGSIGFGIEPGETYQFEAVEIGYITNQQSDANVVFGSGGELTAGTSTFNKTGSIASVGCAADTIDNLAGNLTTTGSGAIAALNCLGGIVKPESSGTVAALKVGNGGNCDGTTGVKARTFTAIDVSSGGKFSYDPSRVTLGAITTSDNILEIKAK